MLEVDVRCLHIPNERCLLFMTLHWMMITVLMMMLLMVVSVDCEWDGVCCWFTVWHWPSVVCCPQISENWWLLSDIRLHKTLKMKNKINEITFKTSSPLPSTS